MIREVPNTFVHPKRASPKASGFSSGHICLVWVALLAWHRDSALAAFRLHPNNYRCDPCSDKSSFPTPSAC